MVQAFSRAFAKSLVISCVSNSENVNLMIKISYKCHRLMNCSRRMWLMNCCHPKISSTVLWGQVLETVLASIYIKSWYKDREHGHPVQCKIRLGILSVQGRRLGVSHQEGDDYNPWVWYHERRGREECTQSMRHPRTCIVLERCPGSIVFHPSSTM